ncbi:MAG: hypothetical protein KDK41_18280, partial [Leptospiraceae bacterium]|nr:hypothetical protein [Leptospiraceae bacterium]
MGARNRKTSERNRAKQSKGKSRIDGIQESLTGRGSSRDKVQSMGPLVWEISPNTAREWYAAQGFIQNIIDA